ncbi:MAG: rRNA maturation RNase YbeY [Gemmatimonadales bacterium]
MGDLVVECSGRATPLSHAAASSIVERVLRSEGIDRGRVDVVFHSVQRMRALNRRTFGHDRATDVIAFPLMHGSDFVGDLYVCPARARQQARRFGVRVRDELTRLLVHGALHLAGHDHPEGESRFDSNMWRLQERYVTAVRDVK